MDGIGGVSYRARMKTPSIVQGVLIAILASSAALVPVSGHSPVEGSNQDSKKRPGMTDAPTSLESTIVFEVVKDGYPHIRIPSILQLVDGTLLVFVDTHERSAELETFRALYERHLLNATEVN